MILLSKLLDNNTVQLDVPCSSQEDILQWIADFFSSNTQFKKEIIYKHLKQREEMGSTGLGYAVAIPHARISGLSEARAVFVGTKPIDFDAPDGVPVQQFFALLVPENATDVHLELLSEIAQLLASPEIRSFLALTENSSSALDKLRSWQPFHSSTSGKF